MKKFIFILLAALVVCGACYVYAQKNAKNEPKTEVKQEKIKDWFPEPVFTERERQPLTKELSEKASSFADAILSQKSVAFHAYLTEVNPDEKTAKKIKAIEERYQADFRSFVHQAVIDKLERNMYPDISLDLERYYAEHFYPFEKEVADLLPDDKRQEFLFQRCLGSKVRISAANQYENRNLGLKYFEDEKRKYERGFQYASDVTFFSLLFSTSAGIIIDGKVSVDDSRSMLQQNVSQSLADSLYKELFQSRQLGDMTAKSQKELVAASFPSYEFKADLDSLGLTEEEKSKALKVIDEINKAHTEELSAIKAYDFPDALNSRIREIIRHKIKDDQKKLLDVLPRTAKEEYTLQITKDAIWSKVMKSVYPFYGEPIIFPVSMPLEKSSQADKIFADAAKRYWKYDDELKAAEEKIKKEAKKIAKQIEEHKIEAKGSVGEGPNTLYFGSEHGYAHYLAQKKFPVTEPISQGASELLKIMNESEKQQLIYLAEDITADYSKYAEKLWELGLMCHNPAK